MKRHSARGVKDTPLVEKLYRENQESYSGAGGFCDDDDEFAEQRELRAEQKQRRIDQQRSTVSAPDDCITCNKPLLDSFLWDRFSHPVCDSCRDENEKHKFLSRTEAMKEFLLKDEDLDLRPPPLRYIARKNPHNPRYGDMKIYLKCQVEARMLEVHGSWEGLERAKAARETEREKRNEKRFEKKVKEMRQRIRGSTNVKVPTKKAHEHKYGEETYNEEKDIYTKSCTECDYQLTYEKM